MLPFDRVVLYDNVEMIVEDDSSLVDKAKFETVFILQFLGFQVTKHGGCWKIICQPEGRTLT